MIYFLTKQKRLFETSDIKICSVEYCLNYFKNHSEIEVDSETYGFDPYTCNTVCWQLGDKNNQFVIESSSYDIKLFKSLLETKLLLLQNAQFDLRFLYHKGIYPKYIYDTMLVEVVLNGGLGNNINDHNYKDIKKDCNKKDVAEKYALYSAGLNGISKKYLGIEISKDLRGILHKEGLTDRVIRYSATDVMHLGEIKKLQLETFEKFKAKYGCSNKLLDLENNVVKVFSRLLYNGINIDYNFYKTRVVDVVNKNVLEYQNKLNDIVKKEKVTRFKTVNPSNKKIKSFEIVYGGDLFNPNFCNINWNSPEQKLGLLKVFSNDLEDTSKAELTKRIETHKIFKEIIQYSKYKKLKDSFGENLLSFVNPVTGRIHSQIWQILATGRISMSKPNLAQIPSKGELGKIIRSAFTPRNKDYVIVGGDYSGMELRIIAEFSQDPLWVTTFKEGGDLHSVLCSETFDIPIEDVKKPFYANPDLTYRDVQKTIDFGLAYGMSKYKLASTILVSVDKAEKIIDKFFSKVPKVASFLETLGNKAKSRGYIKTAPPFSRVRQFPKWNYIQQNSTSNKDKWLGEIERAGKNTPIQGINGDIIKLALIMMQEEIDKNNWDVYILLTVYDEIQAEARKIIADKWVKKHEEIMIKAAETVIKSIPVKCDCKITEHWEK